MDVDRIHVQAGPILLLLDDLLVTKEETETRGGEY